MSKLSKQEYDELVQVPKEYLTQEDLNDIHEYESSEAGAPSDEDLQWARDILNEKDPQIQAAFRKSGDLDKAMSILKQKKAADELMVSRDQDPYVKKVNSTPKDVVEKSNLKFNWRDAYEQTKGEKLRPTEADAKKLQDFINSSMYNVDDDASLKQIAYNLHMYNPNTMKWSDFINSEQGEEFKKYLEDVRNVQTEKAVNDIWEGKESSPQWTPLGYKNVPGAKYAVDFMLPVSKEYARNHYNDKDFSLTGPLTFDTTANIVMAGPGWTSSLPAKASAVGKFFNKPTVSFLYGNVAAPAITETGNVIYNDESIPEGLARTMEGMAINIGTPRILEGMLSSAGRGIPKGDRRSVQKLIDEAANKAAEVQKKMKEGKPFPSASSGKDGVYEYAMNTPEGRRYFSTDPEYSNARFNSERIKFESIENMPAEAVTDAESKAYRQGRPFNREVYDDPTIQKVREYQDEAINRDALILKKALALAKDGNLSSLSPAELRQLGFSDKESFMNWLIRKFKNNVPESVQTYLTNASGRPEFGRRAGPIRNINYLLGTDLFGKDETVEEKQKSRIQRLLGM